MQLKSDKIIIYECKISFQILEWNGGFPRINLTKGFGNSMLDSIQTSGKYEGKKNTAKREGFNKKKTLNQLYIRKIGRHLGHLRGVKLVVSYCM